MAGALDKAAAYREARTGL